MQQLLDIVSRNLDWLAYQFRGWYPHWRMMLRGFSQGEALWIAAFILIGLRLAVRTHQGR